MRTGVGDFFGLPAGKLLALSVGCSALLISDNVGRRRQGASLVPTCYNVYGEALPAITLTLVDMAGVMAEYWLGCLSAIRSSSQLTFGAVVETWTPVRYYARTECQLPTSIRKLAQWQSVVGSN